MAVFEREDRYIVVKRRDLNSRQLGALNHTLAALQIPRRESVVIEADSPIYDKVWGMVEDQWVSDQMTEAK